MSPVMQATGWRIVLTWVMAPLVVRGVSWSEVATVPKRKSHRALDFNLSWNSEEDI